jgi:cytidine deaminase
MTVEDLLKKADEVKKSAYAPYSGFRVGAALLAKSGKVYVGANVENASYSVCCCAERVALFGAVVSGERDFDMIAVTSDAKSITYPCGVCRQALAEFSPRMDVIASNNELEYKVKKLDKLLSDAFTGKDMEK